MNKELLRTLNWVSIGITLPLLLLLARFSDAEQRPIRLCDELLSKRVLPEHSIFIPGTQWKVINNDVQWSKEDGEGLRISGCRGKEIVCVYQFVEPIRLEDYSCLKVNVKVFDGEGTATVCWNDNYGTYQKVGWRNSYKVKLNGDVEEINLALKYNLGIATELLLLFNGEFEKIKLRSTELFPKSIKEPLYCKLNQVRLPCIWEDEAKWDLHIKQGDFLQFAIGCLWLKGFTQEVLKVSDGFKFGIDVDSSNGKKKLFEKDYTEEELVNLIKDGWRFYRTDLGEYADQNIRLIFKIDHLENPYGDYALWGNPMIINTQTSTTQKPPVIIISIDTLRPQNLVTYGYDKPTSFYLDKFAKDAVVFHRAYTPRTFTPVAHMSLLTGLEPLSHGLINGNTSIAPVVVQTSEILKQVGYLTGGFVGFSGWFQPYMGFGKGFDHYCFPAETEYEDAFLVFEKTIDWVEHYSEIPFFVFSHVYDLHSKMESGMQIYDSNDDRFRFFSDLMEAPSELTSECLPANPRSLLQIMIDNLIFKGKSFLLNPYENLYLQTCYDDCIAKVDFALGNFFEYLKTHNLYEKSLIIIVSDHGESFGENGFYEHTGVYENTCRVVMMIKFPNEEFRGTNIYELVSLIDIVPTVLDYIGYHSDKLPYKFDGFSVLPLIKNGKKLRDFLVTQNPSMENLAIIKKDYKYILNGGERKEHLFNLALPDSENLDLSIKKSGILEQMRNMLRNTEKEKERGYIISYKNTSGADVNNTFELLISPDNEVIAIYGTGGTICIPNKGIEYSGSIPTLIRETNFIPDLGKVVIVPKSPQSRIKISLINGPEYSLVLPDQSVIKLEKNKPVDISVPHIYWETEPKFPEDSGPYLAIQRKLATGGGTKIEVPEEVQQQLNALGYLN